MSYEATTTIASRLETPRAPVITDVAPGRVIHLRSPAQSLSTDFNPRVVLARLDVRAVVYDPRARARAPPDNDLIGSRRRETVVAGEIFRRSFSTAGLRASDVLLPRIWTRAQMTFRRPIRRRASSSDDPRRYRFSAMSVYIARSSAMLLSDLRVSK